MAKTIKHIQPTDGTIMNKIYFIRGQKIMLDRDLAKLYNVETKQLKRQVKRNLERFPSDFMFELTKEEFENWRSQFGTSNSGDMMGLRYAPYAFTEQGVAMLATVLNSEIAIQVHIQIIRIFIKMREMMLTHKDILLKLEQLERKADKNDADIRIIFKCLKELVNPPPVPRRKIGFIQDE